MSKKMKLEDTDCTKSDENPDVCCANSKLIVLKKERSKCEELGCSKFARGSRKLCTAHGGGNRCAELNCTKAVQGSTKCCAEHGGGKRCEELDCPKVAQGSKGYCSNHGGGKRCVQPNCPKVAQGSDQYCTGHGGHICQENNCTKQARGSTKFCSMHGGGKRCQLKHCTKAVVGSTSHCKKHGGGKFCEMKHCTATATVMRGSDIYCESHGGVVKGIKNSGIVKPSLIGMGQLDGNNADFSGKHPARVVHKTRCAKPIVETIMLNNSNVIKPGIVRKDKITFVKMVGKGSFGIVYLVKEQQGYVSALKVMKKKSIIASRKVTQTICEKNAMISMTGSPFIAQLRASFETPHHVCLLLEFYPGGDLGYHLAKTGTFSKYSVILYAAQILLALHAIHNKMIVHRDLKPENILLDCQGHIKLTDFGLAEENVEKFSGADRFCGSPGYHAPEMIQCCRGEEESYGTMVDYWALGVLCCDMLEGKTPFENEEGIVVNQKIVEGEIVLPSNISSNFRSFLSSLLKRDSHERFGSGDFQKAEVFDEHLGKNWHVEGNLKLIRPGFLPKISFNNNCDVSNFDPKLTSANPKNSFFGGSGGYCRESTHSKQRAEEKEEEYEKRWEFNWDSRDVIGETILISRGRNREIVTDNRDNGTETFSRDSNTETLPSSGGSNRKTVTDSLGGNREVVTSSRDSSIETISRDSNTEMIPTTGGSNRDIFANSRDGNTETIPSSRGSNRETITHSHKNTKTIPTSGGGKCNRKVDAGSRQSNTETIRSISGSNIKGKFDTGSREGNTATIRSISGSNSNRKVDTGSRESNAETIPSIGSCNSNRKVDTGSREINTETIPTSRGGNRKNVTKGM